MHQKKSEDQIGKESSGVSSDFNPTPPLISTSVIHHKHLQSLPKNPTQFIPYIQIPPPSSSPTTPTTQQLRNDLSSPSSSSSSTTPHKRPMMNNTPSSTISHSPTLSSLHHYRQTTSTSFNFSSPSPFPLSSGTRAAAFRLLRHLRQVLILRDHLRLFLLVSVPSFYFLFNPRRSFLLDFLSALAFSALLLLSFSLAIPRLPSIRLFIARSFHLKLPLSSRSQPPVLWSIGSTPKSEKRVDSGCWVQVYSNGDVYEGEFHKGKCSGSGVYYYYMSGRYEGDWVDEKYDGYGVETWGRGSRYRGQYRHGLRHGYGEYRFYTGDVYAGDWSNGQSHGCGIHTCEDGSWYIGEFKWGVKHGLGHYHFRNGDTYGGEYFSDKMHGFGVYQFANGHHYEGAWHEGRRQGLGMYTFRNGETQSGHWQNGILNIPSTQISHPESPIAVNHSKVLNAVQEARRAAEKVYDVPRVDERVNKAVAAANKAANAARVAAVKAVQKRMHHNNNIDDIPLPIV